MVDQQIKVVIIDDSAFMQKSLSIMLESDPHIKVVATASNGKEGIEKIRQFRPDVVTLDIEMPVMDGLTALRIIMEEMPVPVLMVSSLTTEGASATLEALRLGAVDFIPKELSYVSLNIVKIREDLIAKVKAIHQSRGVQFRLRRIQSATARTVASGQMPKAPRSFFTQPAHHNYQMVVVGVSTGGPFALLHLIPKLPPDFPLGLIIVQHMPPNFTRTLAERLNSLSHLEVREAQDGDRVLPGHVLIAPGGKHLTFAGNGSDLSVRLSLDPSDTPFRPSADVMMTSAAQTVRGPIIGLIMTGMGKDGLEGLRLVKERGGYVIAQNEESCVVYGMPRAVVEAGLADAILPLEQIHDALTQVAYGNRTHP